MAVDSVDIRVPNSTLGKTRQSIDLKGIANTSVDTYTATEDLNPSHM